MVSTPYSLHSSIKNVETLRHLLFQPPLCLYSPIPIFINQRDYSALTFGILFSRLCVKWMILCLVLMSANECKIRCTRKW